MTRYVIKSRTIKRVIAAEKEREFMFKNGGKITYNGLRWWDVYRTNGLIAFGCDNSQAACHPFFNRLICKAWNNLWRTH